MRLMVATYTVRIGTPNILRLCDLSGPHHKKGFATPIGLRHWGPWRGCSGLHLLCTCVLHSLRLVLSLKPLSFVPRGLLLSFDRRDKEVLPLGSLR